MKRIILLLTLLTSLAACLPAQNTDFWMKFPGPSGGAFYNITRAQSGIMYGNYTSYSAELYRSADQGLHWSKLAISRNGQPVSNYIDVGKSGAFNLLVFDSALTTTTLYRSHDEGDNWITVKDSLPFREVYETPGGALLAKTTDFKNIWRSTDGGYNWSFVLNANSNITVPLRILQTGDLIFTNSTGETYRSWDEGLSWQIIGQTAPQKVPLYITQAGALLVVKGQNLYRSTDNGLTWNIIVTVNYQLSSMIVLASGRLLAVATFGNGDDPALYFSDDDGLSWSPQPGDHLIWLYSFPYPLLVPMQLPDGTIFGYCNDALYRSADGGQTWRFSAHGLQKAEVFQLDFAAADTFFAMTPNGLWRTFDNGQQWAKLTDHTGNLFSETHRRRFVSGSAGRLAVITEDSLFWSDDYGAHFSNITPTGSFAPDAIEISPDDAILFANSITPFCILRSVDHGQSWQPSAAAAELNFIQMEFHPSGRIYAAALTSSAGQLPSIWYSGDQGLNWFPVTGLPAEVWFKDLHIDPAGFIYAVGEDPINNRYPLYRSTDNGQSWLRHPVDNGFFSNVSLAGNVAGHLLVKRGSANRSVDQGTSWNVLPPVAGLQILDPISPDQHWFVSNKGLYRTVNPTTQGAFIGGFVRRDADADCSTPDAQAPLRGWPVKAEGANTFYAVTDTSGRYLMFVDTGSYSLRAQTPNAAWWTVCEDARNITADRLLGLDTADFSGAALAECPLMTADISVSRLRRCFNNLIFVEYRNEGTEPADSAWVEVRIDPFTTFVDASIPYLDLGNYTYRFPVGNVPSEAGGHFWIQVYLTCDSTLLGQTHCFLAHAYPDTLCAPVNGWSGAEIQAGVSCQDSTIQFELRNSGIAPSQPLDYIIIIDDVVLMQGNRQYDPGETFVLSQTAGGRTWRIQSEQEPGHPFSRLALAFQEGCGGYNSLGYINRFPVDAYRPSWDRDCVENTGSYDPNDKQGFPLGFGAEHRIRPGQELEYLVRFQNTGTDTAFTVVIRDTLSPWLDPASVRPGAASHPYAWNLSGPGILSFTFNNILLPDSNVNEAASHGFISFRIAQQPGVPLEAEIFNEAAIYFDFNAPIITNRTLHTVGDDYLVKTYTPFPAGYDSRVLVSPNPAREQAVLRPANGPFDRHLITITDARGRVIRQARVSGAQYLFERRGLPEGAYFFRVADKNGRDAGSGRIIVKGSG